MQKNKISNYIIILAVISAILTSLLSQRFFSIGKGMYVASIGASIAFLLALICIKKLRATPRTMKLYNAMIVISLVTIAITIFSIFCVNHLTTTIQEHSFDDVKVRTIMHISNFILYFNYALIVASIVIMAFILFREKTDINWMLLGKLTSSSLIIIKFLIFRLISALGIKSSLLQMISRSQVISIASSLLWVAGAIVMAMQIKKKALYQSTT